MVRDSACVLSNVARGRGDPEPALPESQANCQVARPFSRQPSFATRPAARRSITSPNDPFALAHTLRRAERPCRSLLVAWVTSLRSRSRAPSVAASARADGAFRRQVRQSPREPRPPVLGRRLLAVASLRVRRTTHPAWIGSPRDISCWCAVSPFSCVCNKVIASTTMSRYPRAWERKQKPLAIFRHRCRRSCAALACS